MTVTEYLLHCSPEWRDKHIYVVGGPTEQNWLVHLYLPVTVGENTSYVDAVKRFVNQFEGL